jgi:GNAT superfamily N-acetyltransferase
MDNGDIIRLVKQDAEPAIKSLARAFHEYPLLKYYFPDEKKREKIAYYFMAGSVYSGTGYGEVYATSSNMEGVAVWIPSECYPPTTRLYLRYIPFRIIFGLAWHGFIKLKKLGDYIDSAHVRLAPFRHLFLQTVGVQPEYRGKGYSGKLILPVLARLDAEGLPCYLETLDEKNVSLYEHLGFKVLEESGIPGTPFTNWAMLREPGK